MKGREGVDGKGREERKVRVDIGPLLWILDTLVLLHDHSDIVYCYCYCYKSENCYYKTSINETVKLHVLLSAVLEIENVNAKTSNF